MPPPILSKQIEMPPPILSEHFISSLRSFGASYNQAKVDGKVDLFLRLARMSLWRDSPLIVPSHVEDEPTYRAFAAQKLEEVPYIY